MMKTRAIHTAILLSGVFALSLTGCSTSVYSTSNAPYDDLYQTHDRAQIAAQEQADAQRKLAQYEAQLRAQEKAAQAAYAVNQSQSTGAEAVLGSSATTPSSSAPYNGYEDILAGSYSEAKAMREAGRSDITYRTSGSAINATSSGAIQYASAYDPAFYNVMVAGDQVWVEPKYISSMFGDWGATNVTVNVGLGWSSPRWGYGYNPWYYGYNYNPYHWGSPYWGSSYWGWNSPYWSPSYWGWGSPYWGSPYWGYNSWRPYPGGGYYPAWGAGHHHYNRNVIYGKAGNRNYRPSASSTYRPSGGSYSNGGSSYRRPTSTSGSYTRGEGNSSSQYNKRPSSTGSSSRPTTTSPSNNAGFRRYQSTESNATRNSNSTSYRNNAPTTHTSPSNSGFSGGGFSGGGASHSGGGSYSGGGGSYRR